MNLTLFHMTHLGKSFPSLILMHIVSISWFLGSNTSNLFTEIYIQLFQWLFVELSYKEDFIDNYIYDSFKIKSSMHIEERR